MKVVILAGGLGTRISEESYLRPKPMVEIGGHPILWHIMKIYSAHGIHEFVICCGYKGYIIKEYFANYFLHMSDVTFDMANNSMVVHQQKVEPWRVTLVDTGENRDRRPSKRIAPYVEDEPAFCLTYGDGVSDVDIHSAAIAFHKNHGKQGTLTARQPPARFGALGIEQSAVYAFQEKPRGEGGWINGDSLFCLPSASARSPTTTPPCSPSPPIPSKASLPRKEVQAYSPRVLAGNGYSER